MFFGRPWGWGLCASAAMLTMAAGATAEPLRLHIEGGGATAVIGAQERETGFGFTGEGALQLGITRALGIQLDASAVTLAAGSAPTDPTLAPRGRSSAQAVLVGLRARPFASAYGDRGLSPAGLRADANGGVRH